MAAEPIDHIERPPLPWRAERKTECGKDNAGRVITRAEFYDRVMEQGQQRAAMGVCMTCWSTAQRHAGGYGYATKEQRRHVFVNAWETDPSAVLTRYVVVHRNERITQELRVIAMLVEAHRAEFDEAIAGIDASPSLAQQRQKRSEGRR